MYANLALFTSYGLDKNTTCHHWNTCKLFFTGIRVWLVATRTGISVNVAYEMTRQGIRGLSPTPATSSAIITSNFQAPRARAEIDILARNCVNDL